MRTELRKYFDDKGRNEQWRVKIAKGTYQLLFEDNLPDSHAAVSRLWEPYLSAGARPMATYSEALFFRADSNYVYVRDTSCNDPSGRSRVTRHFPDHKTKDLLASYHYHSAGEVMSMFNFIGLFDNFGRSLPVRVTQKRCYAEEFGDKDLILVGSARINECVGQLQEGYGFNIEDGHIRNFTPKDGELVKYEDEPPAKGKRIRKFALLTRRPNLDRGRTLTMIAANHGRAAQAVSKYLTKEAEVGELLSQISEDAQVPAAFQAVFEVRISRTPEESVFDKVKPVAVRVGAGTRRD